MKLTTRCSSCKKDVRIKSSASTRPELQMEKGNEFTVNCQNCGKLEKKHVNDIRAEINNQIIFIGIGIGILSAVILWSMFGAVGTISVTIPIIFWYQQMDAIKGFNSYKIRRK
ncbi:hypothetical protein GCM10009430_46270 [Aquimarina litoralis]|uniref:Cxxc_20_cxxc protein n=1 Tax=Aquimarina litoralis TaxID=584605 RepID=A0ABN1J964_9FLAO